MLLLKTIAAAPAYHAAGQILTDASGTEEGGKRRHVNITLAERRGFFLTFQCLLRRNNPALSKNEGCSIIMRRDVEFCNK